ncbi:MAG: hypothetical protein M0Z73_05250 [Betaproteobacteria bacterium]|nr:hypothetical protein [Betaproteobacteria bacterium]
MGSKSTQAPDYSGIAASNNQAAAYAKDAADADLAFRKQVYAETQPRYNQLLDMANQVSQSQLDTAAQQQKFGQDQQAYYDSTFKPVEQSTVLDAYGGQYMNADQLAQARQAMATGDTATLYGLSKTASETATSQAQEQAGADVNSAFTQQAQNLMRLGGDPNKMAAMAVQLGNTEALAKAQASNTARQQVLGQGIALRSGVANFGRNMPNTAGQAAGLSIGAGTSAVNSATSGFNSGLTYPQYVSGAVGGQQNAAGMRIGANNGLAGPQQSGAIASMNANDELGGIVLGAVSTYGGRMLGSATANASAGGYA